MSTAYHLIHSYRTVGTEELHGFPKHLGMSDNWVPNTVTLGTQGGSGTLTLVSDPPYDSSLHPSIGVGSGTFQFDMATRTSRGWGGAIVRYLEMGKPCVWTPAEPGEGTFRLTVEVSAEDAAAVRTAEREHIEDFQLAWDSSFGVVAGLLPRCSADSPEEAIKALVTHLVDAGAAYLIPAEPDDPDNWGPRLLTVYQALCAHSYKRDEKGHHSPVKYEFTVRGDEILIRFVTGPNRPSTEYVIPGEIPPVFTAAGYEEYALKNKTADLGLPVATDAGLEVGVKVVWSDAADGQAYEEYPQGPSLEEQIIHDIPSLDTLRYKADIGAINSRLHFEGGTVVALDDTHAWVKINFQDRDGEGEVFWISGAAKELDLPGGDGYVRLRRHMLKPKPKSKA
ncbi:hypothetical protein FHS43_004396 [Streptosporangium becharense]|uniref:Uncharacterized protein n=1 Tax=Streptosporangium becharense TaxID=1816182 RepID=A0A7W9IKQ0_9ACTN|nr:hypothetical protein [Streptosporangium becharense]MBB2913098.1 hypothetical protein [Streptosporangium becharense]MBB5822081.1 hypothetical protein [Streptosporangium becharense]